MRLIDTVAELSAALDDERKEGRSIGLVPTMGALHRGHVSLAERAVVECSTVCLTLFVNPLQFGPEEDLTAYPRPLYDDLVVAKAAGVTMVFCPPLQEMFEDEVLTTVRVERLSAALEGLSRPRHLEGVATMVAKLFAMTGRCRAYFGEKDFQQLVVVRRMAADLSFPVDVVGCPIVRESDGLALSSRNAYLDAEERRAAPVLHEALRAGADAVESGMTNPAMVSSLMAEVVAGEPLAVLDYVAVVDPFTLLTPTELEGEVRLLGAARFGRARLIDNVAATVGS